MWGRYLFLSFRDGDRLSLSRCPLAFVGPLFICCSDSDRDEKEDQRDDDGVLRGFRADDNRVLLAYCILVGNTHIINIIRSITATSLLAAAVARPHTQARRVGCGRGCRWWWWWLWWWLVDAQNKRRKYSNKHSLDSLVWIEWGGECVHVAGAGCRPSFVSCKHYRSDSMILLWWWLQDGLTTSTG